METASAATAAQAPRRRFGSGRLGPLLSRGAATAYLSAIVLVPLAAVLARSLDDGLSAFWDSVTAPAALDALLLTVVASLIVVAIDLVMGTAIAWVLVRDQFAGKRFVDALVDLPFALPTIVAGLTLLTLYGPSSPVGIDLAFTQTAIVLAMLFVTLPFVVRAVQPVLHDLDPEAEEAAASLGASRLMTIRRVVLPVLRPAILTGCALAFARAVGEFGSIVLISGNLPHKTQVTSVLIFGQIESGQTTGAAAVAVVLLAVSVAVIAVIQMLARRGGVQEV